MTLFARTECRDASVERLGIIALGGGRNLVIALIGVEACHLFIQQFKDAGDALSKLHIYKNKGAKIIGDAAAAALATVMDPGTVADAEQAGAIAGGVGVAEARHDHMMGQVEANARQGANILHDEGMESYNTDDYILNYRKMKQSEKAMDDLEKSTQSREIKIKLWMD